MRTLVAGALAGAAGTTALDAVAYGDMALRGRGPSSTPERTAGRMAGLLGIRSLGPGDTGRHRASGLGALLGIGTGVVAGGVVAVVGRGRGSLPVSVGALAAAATVGSVVPMSALKVTDPRGWSATDWLADVIPHLAYGTVAALVLRGLLAPAR